ncbi:MAG: helix-turn-helix transcriptional regulator [Paracoccaceae bacterium]
MPEPADKTETGLGKTIAALSGERFVEQFHSWLFQCLAFDNCTILAYFQRRPPELIFRRAREQRVHAKIETVYLKGAYLLDPFHELHVQKVASGLYRLKDIAPDHFQRNQYYLDYYRRTTLVDEMAFVAYPGRGVCIQVCIGRDATSGRRFSVRQVENARRIAPIVTGLVQSHWRDLSAAEDLAQSSLQGRLADMVHAAHAIRLSPRQAQVAILILRGHSSASIGLRLKISPQTVKVFRKQLYRKCNISSQAELFALMLPLLAGKTEG